jgi:hypothetical protein
VTLPAAYGELPVYTKHCPWALVAADPRIGTWLSTFWRVKTYNRWPEGRSDPQLMEAIAVLEGEHAAITREEQDLARLRSQ